MEQENNPSKDKLPNSDELSHKDPEHLLQSFAKMEKAENTKQEDNSNRKKSNKGKLSHTEMEAFNPEHLFNQFADMEAEIERTNNMKQDDNPDRNKLSYKEVEALIPDYLFNRLTEAERGEFEIAVVDFPDLEKELQDGKELFDLVEKLDYQKIISDKSQYLPNRVVARLEKKHTLFQPQELNRRKYFMICGFAAILFGVMYFLQPKNKNVVPDVHITSDFQSDKAMFSILEETMIYEEFQDLSVVDFFYEILGSYNIDDKISWGMFDDDMIDETYSALTMANFSHDINYFSKLSFDDNYNYLILLNQIDYIDEESFQILMENLRNEEN